MSELFNLLIAEDDQTLASALKMMAPSGFKIYMMSNPNLIPDHVFFHAAMVDMHMISKVGEVADGPVLIEKLVKKNPQVEIVAMSGDLNRDNMEASIKAGAQRFLSKPLLAEEVTLVLEKILAYWQLRQIEFSQHSKINLIGQSEETEKLRKKIASLKNEKTAILIEGETGTGKEIVARLLNQQEGRRPFVTINCAAINEALFESEFFGHTKGAFTGADHNKIGLAEAAHGGDLFLDEIEALPLSQQAKLLRFLESGEIRKVGAKESLHVEVRVICASNQSLSQMVKDKKFREDLYFRLSSQKIELSPLKQRKLDIPLIAQFFLEIEKPKRNKQFDPDALVALQDYAWPGNVRELKRICEQLVLTSALPMIRKEDVVRLLQPLPLSPATGYAGQTFEQASSLEDFMNMQEKDFISYCLKNTTSLDEACQALKISKSNLYKKIKDHGIHHE